MSTPDYQGLSDQLREFYASLNSEIQDRFLTVLQMTFGVKNRRNAELWVTSSATRRSFINRQTPPLELEMREAFVKALINNIPPTTLQKVTTITNDPIRASRKIRQYLVEDFTRESVTSIGFLPDKILYTYDADSNAFDDIDDEASDEFATIPTDPKPQLPPNNNP